MPLTDQINVVAEAVRAKIDLNKVSLGVQDVFYGDQQRIPRTPAVCVEAGTKTRDHAGMLFQTMVEMPIIIMVYVSKIDDSQANRKDADQLAETIEALLHQDKQLGGLVIYGMVEAVDSGYAHRGGALMRAVRMVWSGKSKVQI